MLALFIRSLAGGEISDFAGRIRTKLIIYCLVILAFACGIVFFVVAAYIAAAVRYGAVSAAVLFGFGFIVLALVVFGVHRAVEAAGARRRRKRARSAELTGILGAAAAAVLPSLLRSRIGLAELLAPVVAIAAYEIYRENSGKKASHPEDREDIE